MSLKITPIDHDDLCFGWQWSISDEKALSAQVAAIAMGQYRHVARILAVSGVDLPKGDPEIASDAIDALTLSPGADPWHRDGWLFQTISWIAAHPNKEDALLRPPHIRKADKGFDGLQLELSGDGKSVTAVVIFEDKATANARSTIRDEVWPGIEALESGRRIAELTHDVTAALEAHQRDLPDLDVDSAVASILWKDVRQYRVSITVSDTHSTPEGRKSLFKDYNTRL